jgi:hypothetical protein
MANFIAAKVAQLIASDELPADSAQLRFKNFVAKGYILTRVRDESDGRGTLVFGIGDVVTAAVLSQMVDLGGLSKEAMQAAASRLHGWRPGEVWTPDTEWLAAAQKAANEGKDLPERPLGIEKEPESPAEYIWDTFAANPSVPPGFILRVQWQRPPSGSVNVAATIIHGDNGEIGAGLILPPGNVPVADLVIPIDPLLPELAARIARMKAAH